MNADDERKARLAAALRENLRRRKAQSRKQVSRGEGDPAPPPPLPGESRD